MFMFVLIGLCLVLLGVAGLEFTYLFYVERILRERRKHQQMLEHRCNDLIDKLDAAELRIREQSDLISSMSVGALVEEEAWADLIEDR